MAHIIMSNDAPECPLCGNRMQEVFHGTTFFYCCYRPMCMISIRKDDPCCGKWNEKPENAPECPLCKERMKIFFRADRSFIAQCRNKNHHPVQVARMNAEELPPLEDTAPHG